MDPAAVVLSAAGDVTFDGSMQWGEDARPVGGTLLVRASRLSGTVSGTPLPASLAPATFELHGAGLIDDGPAGRTAVLDLDATIQSGGLGRISAEGVARSALDTASLSDPEFDLRVASSPLRLEQISTVLDAPGIDARAARLRDRLRSGVRDGVITLKARVRGRPSGFAFDASPEISAREVIEGDVRLSGLRASGRAEGKFTHGAFGRIALQRLSVTGSAATGSLAPRPFTLKAGRGTIDPAASAAEFAPVSLELCRPREPRGFGPLAKRPGRISSSSGRWICRA